MLAKSVLAKLFDRSNLSFDESASVMGAIMNGNYTNAQIAAILTALRMKGETAEEIAGLSSAMKELSFPIRQVPEALDVVGTGGATFKTFNVSSMTGLVLSSMGLKVAKHGNRSNTSKCGSADFLEGMGINLRLDPDKAYNVLNDHNFVYLFAPFYHRSMKHAITARKELQARTVFNILGPLTNPMGVKQSLIGVFDPDLLELIGEALLRRGQQRAAIISNRHGADEILNNGITDVVELKNGALERYEVTVEDFGLDPLPIESLSNMDVEQSVLAGREILKGEISPLSEFVAINGAMAMKVNGSGEDLTRNTSQILDHIQSGKVIGHVQDLVKATGGRIELYAN